MELLKSLMKIGALVGCCLFLSTALSPCLAADDSLWMVRARVLGIFPDDSSRQITLIGREADVEKTTI